MKKALIIDGNNILFKAYYATAAQGANLHNMQGVPTNALYAFIRMLTKFIKNNNYDSIYVAFDASKKTFRHDTLATYKGKRSATPTELIDQFHLTKAFLDLAHIPWGQLESYEADDLIATIVSSDKAKNYEIDIMSSDKDLWQLLTPTTKILNPQKGMSSLKVITTDSFNAEFNLTPQQVPDLKGLMGDSSDNLPGIKGIGLKTATTLLQQYHNLENIIANVDNLKPSISKLVKTNSENGIICKKLAQLVTNVPLKGNIETFTYNINNLDSSELQKFYQKYDMKSLLVNDIAPEKKVNNKESHIKIITSWNNEWSCPENYLWLEIFGENYHRDPIIGYGISNNKGTFYLNRANAQNCQQWQQFLANDKYHKITWDLKKVINGSARINLKINGIIFDAMLAAYLLDANATTSPLNTTALLNIPSNNSLNREQFYGSGVKKTLPQDEQLQAEFMEHHLQFLHTCYQPLIATLKRNNNYQLYQEIEFPSAFALANMEQNGVNVDQEALAILSKKTSSDIATLEQQIKATVNSDINPNSPKQISNYLFNDLKLPNYKKGSTAVDVLLNLQGKHPIIDLLLTHRKLQKLYSTYLFGLQKYLFADGKIHSIYLQGQTSTGRLSSIDPNMQNITIRDEVQRRVRKIFIPSNSNNKILSCDYSQIELRILAHISGDTNLINAFNNNHDIHSETASKIFNIPLKTITAEQRRKAKAINFGIVYGISGFGLAKQLAINVKDAQIFIDKYFAIFADIKVYIKNIIKFCETNGYVETIFKRKRKVPEINDNNKILQNFGKRVAMNMPIQGSAADILKLAMNKIYAEIQANNIDAQLIAQIHDELIFEVPATKINSVAQKISTIMTNIVKLQVPLVINVSIANNWFDLK